MQDQQDLIPNKFGTKDVMDVFTAPNHSFLIQVKKGGRRVLKAWGLNNFGQLGLDNQDNQWLPQEVEFFNGIPVRYVTGCNESTLLLTENDQIYSWGRNDQGQLGRENITLEDGQVQSVFLAPQRIEFFNENRINKLCSSGNYSYALNTDNNQLYSWGMGCSYVLGDRQENTVFNPFTIPQGFYFNRRVDQISLGSQHVVVGLLGETNEKPAFEYDISTYIAMIPVKPKVERKRKRNLLDEINEVAERYQKEQRSSRRTKETVKKYKESKPKADRSKSKKKSTKKNDENKTKINKSKKK
jgi:alpha-tubulin suppressor-like RCC1 family protein